jgi:outer membrane biosynthesis protein TonB
MTAIPDHYAALGIDPTADPEVIAAAYRALAKKFHPDTGATTGTASPQRFAEIQQAYEVLGSAESRSRYDLELLEATQRELDEHLAKKQRKIAGAAGAPPPPPDLGDIRPERRGRKPTPWNLAISLKEMGPFLVVSGLLMAVAGGLASLYLSNAPLPPVEEPPPAEVASAPDAAPEPPPAPEPPQQQAAIPQQPPLFGTSMMDAPDPAPAPEQDTEAASVPPPTVVPVPKARPLEAAAAPAPVQTEARARRFTVVIYEKYRSGDTIQEEARVVFASEARCAAFGERAVLRRLAPFEGQRQRPRIWYECTEAP